MKTIIFATLFLGNLVLCLAQEQQIEENKTPSVHAGLYSGAWIPTGSLSEIGSHPFIGMQMNIGYRKMHYQMFFDFRLFPSKNNYDFYYRYDDSIVSTDNFYSAQYGLAVGRELYRSTKNVLVLRLGIAADFIKALDEPDSKSTYYYAVPIQTMEEEDQDKYMNTYNVSLGLSDRIILNNGNYLELGANYHFVDYTMKSKSSLDGDVLSLVFSYNFMLR